LGLSGLAGCTSGAKPRLNVINYTDYIGPDTIANFEREFDVRVRYSGVIEGSEEVIAKTISGNSGWDVVFPENRIAGPMRELGLLAPLDHARLANLKHLAPFFQKPAWDPALAWSLPYLWSGCGILHQGNLAIASWEDFFAPQHHRRITLLDEPSEVFALCLKMLGLSINTDSPDELRRAQKLALEHRKWIRAYLNTEVRDQVAAGDVLAAHLWQGSAQLSIDEAEHLRFTYPREGYSLYCDCVAILAESKRKDLAHEFLNYLHRPEVAREIAEASRCSSPQQMDTALDRGEWFETPSAETQRLRDRLWTEIKSA
jgi:spermidine/putrescine transport system substrate-binding protein